MNINIVAWVQRHLEMITPSIILQDTLIGPLSIEFHWHVELFFEAVMKSLCTVLAVIEMFELARACLKSYHMHACMWLLPGYPEIARLH